jgi:hypothetical protein
MSKTNCINCGAAKNTDEIKCPFCGTTYLDLTAIDFSSDDPVVCKFVLPYEKDKIILSMIARPHLEEISQTENKVDAYGFGGNKLYEFTSSIDMNIGISFKPIAKPNESLYSLKAASI